MEKGKTMAEISLGEVFERNFSVTDERIRLFAAATGDDNPIHLDEEEAKKSIFKTRVAHGMLSAGFLSAVLGTGFPGRGTIYLGQTLKFMKPVFPGDEITVRLTVVEKIPEKNRLRLETVCLNQKGDQVLAGEAQVMPPA
ncbi:MAG: MaoC family dehydratase [Pseudomonadota bacterium]